MSDKLQAFRAFDFEGNDGWRSYKLNLEVPPGKEALLEKFKAKWYQKNIDPDFDINLVTSSKPSEVPPTREAPPSSQPKQQEPQSTASPRPQPAPASAQPAGGGAGWRAADPRQLLLVVAHIVVFNLAVVSLQPLNRLLAYRAYFICLRIAVATLAAKILLKHGRPSFSPFPGALQAWIQPVAGSTDFFYFMLSGLMLQNPGMWLGVVPLGILSLYNASAGINNAFGRHALWRRFGLRGHKWLAANQEVALRVCALADITVGFQAILSIFRVGIRSAMLAYVYFNQLRLRFCTPESRPYHLWAWKFVHAKVQPLLTAVPALQRYVAMGQRWFDQPRLQQQGRR